MKQIERTKTITYRWWRSDKTHIEPEHIKALEESADEQILDMMGNGLVEGDLFEIFRTPKRTVYSGWWGMTEKL